MTPRALLVVGFGLLVTACSTETRTEQVRTYGGDAVAHGRALFSDPAASPSPANRFACAHCHRTTAATDARILPGARLDGACDRPSYWGGQELDLLRAVNHCRFYFMRGSQPWASTDEEAQAIWALLRSLEGSAAAQPFTVVKVVADVPAGAAAAGAAVYSGACQLCHGSPHDGVGRLTDEAPILPEQVLAEHQGYTPAEQRLVFVEKVRHGGFLGYDGVMPPFSVEALSDQALGDLLAYLGVD
jgi:thiosulfate dehydrogenase